MNWPKRAAYLGLLLSLAAFGYLVRSYYLNQSFFSDDALISLRYSERFASGRGLTWDNFDKVEGYSDFLWVLLCALPMKFGIDGMVAARWLDTVGALGAIILAGIGPIRLTPVMGRAWFGSMFAGSLVPLAVWAIGGLEHGFMAAVIMGALLLLDRARHRSKARRAAFIYASLPLVALTLLRADGAVLVFGLGVGYFVSTRPSRRTVTDALLLVAPSVVAWLGQLAFRHAYYGEWVPNTAKAKVAFNLARVEIGVQHVRAGLAPLLITLGLAVGLLLMSRFRRFYRVVPALAVTFFWTLYLVAVGGDIFPGWRQLLLGLVPLAFVLGTLGSEAFSSKRARWFQLIAPVLFFAQLQFQLAEPENIRANTERWEWEGRSVGPALRTAFAEKSPLLAVDAAGALPYWTGFPSLDMLGLNDRFLAENPPAWHGKDRSIGHDLGDPDYFLRRKPDLIAFCNAAGAERPCFRASQLLVQRPEFQRDYRAVRFRGQGPIAATGTIYVRLNGLTGIENRRGALVFPGYLLASPASDAESFLEGNRFVTRVARTRPGLLARVKLPGGSFAVRTIGEGKTVLSMRCGQRSARESTTEMTAEGGTGDFDLLVAPTNNAAVVREVVFERVNSQPTHSCRAVNTVVPAESLTSFEDGSHWLAPPAVLADRRGFSLSIHDGKLGDAIRITSDNNDELSLAFSDQAGPFWTVLTPTMRDPGMRTRRLEVPKEYTGRAVTSVGIVPQSGDGNYSVSGFSLR